MNEYGASESKIVFLEGLPGVGKTTLVNALKLKKNKNIHTVDEIIVNLQEKTPINQNIFIVNDNKKINSYCSGTIVIDRGPISTLSYNQVRAMLDKSFSKDDILFSKETFSSKLCFAFNSLNSSSSASFHLIDSFKVLTFSLSFEFSEE